MSSVVPPKPTGLAALFAWRRVLATTAFTLLISTPIATGWKSGAGSLYVRALALAYTAMLVFGIIEQWPRRLPRWVARWVLQVIGVAAVLPFATMAIYIASTPHGAPRFWMDKERLEGFGMLLGLSLFLAPWVALAALIRQKEALARHQALAFDLERSELQRRALDARLHLLQAQVAPHFLFNTLANVQALVETASPQAPAVLRSLIAYLRAAVPRLDETGTSFRDEIALVQAYLELMHMRMPDRLAFAVDADAAALGLRCPALSVLTLVENAVRHGIDPSEEGGRIDVLLRRDGPRCRVQVSDTGVGLREGGGQRGTGLTTLQERLRLAFGDSARLTVRGQSPRGVCADIDVPAQALT
jgi:hypothetical protein